jgi:hypothetical protein
MTQFVCRNVGIVLFVAFTVYGFLGTRRVARGSNGPRPWALFALFELIEAVQVYALIAGPSPRPIADVRSGAIVCVAALCFCAFLQRLYLVSAAGGGSVFPRRLFYASTAVFIAVVIAARYAAPVLP